MIGCIRKETGRPCSGKQLTKYTKNQANKIQSKNNFGEMSRCARQMITCDSAYHGSSRASGKNFVDDCTNSIL